MSKDEIEIVTNRLLKHLLKIFGFFNFMLKTHLLDVGIKNENTFFK